MGWGCKPRLSPLARHTGLHFTPAQDFGSGDLKALRELKRQIRFHIERGESPAGPAGSM